jgi:hypothetical protein
VAASQCGAAAAMAPVPPASYSVGDAVAVDWPLPGGAAARGRFSVPAPGAGAACDDALGQVAFLQRVPHSLQVRSAGE